MKTYAVICIAWIIAGEFAFAWVRGASVPSVSSSAATASASGPTAAPPAGSATARRPYVLHAMDKVFLNVLSDAKASQEYRIGQDGTVTLAYLDNPVKLAGLTVPEAVRAVAKEYEEKKIYIHPQLTLVVKEYAERKINFLGQVNKPGTVLIPAEGELTLVEAFAQAGGHTRNASRYCNITRLAAGGKSVTIRYNLWEAVKDARKDLPLQEGDTIHLGESTLGDAWND